MPFPPFHRRIGLLGGLLGGLFAVCLGVPSEAAAISPPPWAMPVSTGNLAVLGMVPTEVTEWTLLDADMTADLPMAVVMAKAVTTAGETTLDAVLGTKYSIGIYVYQPRLNRWMPVWERVTGTLTVGFVEGFEIADVNGDGRREVCIRIRYSGPNRALDYIVKTVDNGLVRDLFEEKSIYRGAVTAASGAIVVRREIPGTPDIQQREVFTWTPTQKRFEKVSEQRLRIRE